jgi:ribonuclease HI
MEARIYLRTSYHGLRKAEGCYCAILEADTSEGEKTLEETGKDTGTANQIALLGLIKAMEHMRRASDLEIFTDSKYLESGVNRFLDDWIAADFRKQNGEPVKNSILWQRAAELLAPHNINICYEEHTKYSMWQDRRMREYEQEQKNKSVHLR